LKYPPIEATSENAQSEESAYIYIIVVEYFSIPVDPNPSDMPLYPDLPAYTKKSDPIR